MQKQRLAWAITGSGHYLRESLAILKTLENVDIFLSKAAAEIIKQYGFQAQLDVTGHKVYQDKTASSVPVELFYAGKYHTLVIAPATSNTVAKMAYGFSDSLVTNLMLRQAKRACQVLFLLAIPCQYQVNIRLIPLRRVIMLCKSIRAKLIWIMCKN